MLDVALERKVVQKAGSYFSFGDERLGQGRQNATAFLAREPRPRPADPRAASRPRLRTSRSSRRGCCPHAEAAVRARDEEGGPSSARSPRRQTLARAAANRVPSSERRYESMSVASSAAGLAANHDADCDVTPSRRPQRDGDARAAATRLRSARARATRLDRRLAGRGSPSRARARARGASPDGARRRRTVRASRAPHHSPSRGAGDALIRARLAAAGVDDGGCRRGSSPRSSASRARPRASWNARRPAKTTRYLYRKGFSEESSRAPLQTAPTAS